MTSLLLRADATPDIGVGHLSRCVAVATVARARGWDVALCGTFTAGEWLLGDLPVVPSLRPADVVLVDHYGLGSVSLPSLVVSMEDGPFGRRRADIVVDASLRPAARPSDGSPVVLRGPAYAPLRAEIRAARAVRGGGTEPPTVVVVMGGGAAPSAVAAAVKAVRATGVLVKVVAVSAVEVPGVEVIPPTPALPSLFASADLVVSAAGVTLLELCCIGVPTALVRIADNQTAGYQAAVEQGLAAGLGTDPREHVETLRTLLLDTPARKALGEKAKTVVDGRGAERILNAAETALRHESPIGAPGGPPFSTLPTGTDRTAHSTRTDGPFVRTPPKSDTSAASGPPESSLASSTDSSGSSEQAGEEVHPANPSESPIGAPGGPPVSTLPAGTDSSGSSEQAAEEVHPANPSESPTRAPGGPPISTLPASTDNSGGSLVVRPAVEADSALLLAWRNDSETRAWSRTTDPVAPRDHTAWLNRVLADPDRRLLIAEYECRAVGTVRFDRDGDHWEISITVAPEARGRKLAVPMLLAAERTLPRTTVRACVHRDNTASLALFRKAGYQDAETDDTWRWFVKAV